LIRRGRRLAVAVAAAGLLPLAPLAAAAAPPPVSRPSAQPQDGLPAPLVRQIDRAVQQTLSATSTPSASIAILRDGRIAYAHAYGQARLSPARAATVATRYQVASLSKQFTAAAVLLLVQDGRLSLDDTVGRFFPELTDADRITVRQLLGHTSGYEDFWPQDYVMAPMTRPTTPDAIIAGWGRKPLDFGPGHDFQYSNTGYVIAARIVEKVSGQPFFSFLRTRILSPLHMDDVRDAATEPTAAPADAVGYERAALGPLRPAPIAGTGWLFGAAEMVATAGDIARWDEALLAPALLTPASVAAMTTSSRLADGKETGYGLGQFVSRRDGRLRWEHTGEGAGFLSSNRIYPEDGIAVVVLTNTLSSDAFLDIADRLDAILLTPKGFDAEARRLFDGLQRGHPDRTAFTDDFNAYLDPQTVADYARTLGPLGQPTHFSLLRTARRGGMEHRLYRIIAGGMTLDLSVFVRPNGKVEQFLVQRAVPG